MYYAVVDCDNCYVSCERVFRPDLNGKPVVVLSNNDGCVVARSNEAKKMGVRAGTPFFKLSALFPERKIAVLSSNYELYGELTRRVMKIIGDEAPLYYRYSIDEAFVILPFNLGGDEIRLWGANLHKKIMKCVGIPVSVGIGPTKTIAKMACLFAKHYKGYRHCCVIDNEEKRVKAEKLCPVGEVWGIGGNIARRLIAMGDTTAFDFASHSGGWVRTQFNIVLERTWRELRGEDCVPNETVLRKKSISTSRSFNGMVGDPDTLSTHIANYAARCADKLRRQHSAATVVGVFIQSNHFRQDLTQYDNFTDSTLLTPTNATQIIAKEALACLRRIYKEGILYKRAGCVVMGIQSENGIQTNFVDYDAERFEKIKRLDKIIEHINKTEGGETVVLGAQQYTERDRDGKVKSGKFADAIRHSFRSKNPTTRWSDIIILH